MRLNNRGITTVEVLLCFVLIAVISNSLYTTVSAFNEKRLEEKNRSKLILYTNTLTKTIQDDFIFIGLQDAKINKTVNGGIIINELTCTLNDGSTRILRVKQRFTKSPSHVDGSTTEDDYFSIEYGASNKIEEYPLPELGEVKGKYSGDVFEPCDASNCKIHKDLQINNVLMEVTNEDKSDSVYSHILKIYIGFYHPELGNKYAINIVSPIGYSFYSSR